MNNPKTTIAGYLTLVAAVTVLVSHLLTGGLVTGDITAVMGAAAGVGLIMGRDGGH